MVRIAVGSQTLHFEDSGGGGPAILFCHCLTMTGAMFSPQLEAFAHRYRCITWDQRGHGQSPASSPFTLWDSARDALALMDRLEIDRAIFVGASQGGFVSLRAALLAPDRVCGLGVMGTSAAAEDPMQKTAHEQLHAALFSADGPPEALLDMLEQSFFGQRFDPGPGREDLRHLPKDQADYHSAQLSTATRSRPS
jgi:3-oxoadipate enol-lactonase